MMQAQENTNTAIFLLRRYVAKGWVVQTSCDSNPRIGSAFRAVDELQEIAIGWASR